MTALESIRNMPGLKRAKAEIISRLYEFEINRKLYGLQIARKLSISGNMLFVGAPGTCKTTFARLFGEGLKESGVFSADKYKFVEVSRADITKKYQGETEESMKAIIGSIDEGILFIDEAYSLAGKAGSERQDIGNIALDVLVAETEKLKNVLIILAGYEFEMNEMMSVNSGLKSRFPCLIRFDSYTTEELIQIIQIQAEKMGREITSEALPVIMEILDEKRKDPNFGNGRYTDALLVEACRKSAVRIINENGGFETFRSKSDVPAEELRILNAQDFLPVLNDVVSKNTKERIIGFS